MRFRPIVWVVSFVCVMLHLFSSGLLAQSRPSVLVKVVGQVVDSQGKPVAGATITTRPEHKMKSDPAPVSGSDGRFEIMIHPSFSHLIHASLDEGRLQGVARATPRISQGSDVDGPGEIEVIVEILPAVSVRTAIVDAQNQAVTGATVAIVGSDTSNLGLGAGYREGTSESEGDCTVLIPQVWTNLRVVGICNGKGMAFTDIKRDSNADDVDLTESPIQLIGAKPLVFRVTDWSDQPLGDATIQLSSISQSPSESIELQSIARQLCVARTDSQGLARFEWYPQWSTSFSAMVNASSDAFCFPLVSSDLPTGPDGIYRVRLSRLVSVRGRVVRSDGSVPGEVEVLANRPTLNAAAVRFPEGVDTDRELHRLQLETSHYQFFGPRTVKTDENGQFELRLPPMPNYVIFAREKGWVSRVKAGVDCWESIPSEDHELTLYPAKKVTGRVTIANEPRGNAELRFGLLEAPGDRKNPPRRFVHHYHFKTDRDGRYEIELGPGHYMTAVALFTKTPGNTPFFQIDESGGELTMDFNQ